jgi:hypothetical protein
MRAVPIEEGVVPICPGPGSEPMRSASTRRDHGDVSLFGLHQECRPAPLVSRLLFATMVTTPEASRCGGGIAACRWLGNNLTLRDVHRGNKCEPARTDGDFSGRTGADRIWTDASY